MLVAEDRGKDACGQCEQVDDLLCLVAEYKEEVDRLRSIRECKSEVDCWSHTLPSLREAQWMEAQQDLEEPPPLLPSVRRRRPKRWQRMESGPCSGR